MDCSEVEELLLHFLLLLGRFENQFGCLKLLNYRILRKFRSDFERLAEWCSKYLGPLSSKGLQHRVKR